MPVGHDEDLLNSLIESAMKLEGALVEEVRD